MAVNERGGPGLANPNKGIRKWNAATRQKLLLALSTGNTPQTACQYAGCTYDVFRVWMQRGEFLEERGDLYTPEEQEYVDFYHEANEAEIRTELQAVGAWQKQFSKDWKAARDYLARRYPKKWGQRVEIDVGRKDEEILTLLAAVSQVDEEHKPIDVPSNLALPSADATDGDAEAASG